MIPQLGEPIKIDREGTWFYQNVEIEHEEIRRYLGEHLVRDPDGRYFIQIHGKRCPVEVEDTPFIVEQIEPLEFPPEGFQITLHEGTTEELNLETLTISPNQIFYCRVKNGKFPARFSKAACYQMADYVDYDPSKDQYLFKIGKQDSPLILPLKKNSP
ncbi:MAG: DUF1285 domain-containing protein [Candidatus Hadarchaeum sp.]